MEISPLSAEAEESTNRCASGELALSSQLMPSPTMPSRLKSVLNSDSVLRMSSTREDLSVEVRTEVLLVRASLLMSMREMPEKESAPVRRSVV